MNKDNKISIIFFGTHDFAASILQGLIDSGLFEIDLVITQPDQPVGRKQVLTPPPVKILAEKYNLKIDQPITLKSYVLGLKSEDIRYKTYDIGVCCQYGLIIPQIILDTFKHGIINIHTSLLPKYRGASPIQTALINGETETGVTIMKMDAGMDTGAILAQKSLSIDPNDTYTTLSEKLAKTAILCLPDVLQDYVSGKIIPQAQDNTLTTYTKILSREDGKIDWSKSADDIYNQYRGLTPWPGVWTTTSETTSNLKINKRVKLLKILPSNLKFDIGYWILDIDKLYIGCKDGAIEVLELQMEGSKVMDAKSFVNGYMN